MLRLPPFRFRSADSLAEAAAILAGLRTRADGGEPPTVVVVAYRKATIALADEVVVINHGRLVVHSDVTDLVSHADRGVRVRTDEPERLRDLLQEADTTAELTGAPVVLEDLTHRVLMCELLGRPYEPVVSVCQISTNAFLIGWPVAGSTTLTSRCGCTRPTVEVRRSRSSSAPVWVDTGDVSVIPYACCSRSPLSDHSLISSSGAGATARPGSNRREYRSARAGESRRRAGTAGGHGEPLHVEPHQLRRGAQPRHIGRGQSEKLHRAH